MIRERGFSYALLLAGVAVVVALAAAVYFAVRPDPARREFELAQQAVRQVQSWRHEHALPSFGGVREGRVHEVVCPDRQRVTVQFKGTRGDKAVDESSEIYFIQGASYQRDETGVMRRGRQDFFNPEPLCLQLARGEDTHPFPPFGKFLKSGIFREGSITTVGGVKCRQWRVLFPVMQSADNEEVCIGLDDHLPRYRRNLIDKITYSDYNATFAIYPPI